MQKTFGEKVIEFNTQLNYSGELPPGFRVMNPFLDNPETSRVMKQFYRKYYADHHPRRWIIGINPGRHGAGVTGIPFTDTKQLQNECDILMHTAASHEVSASFVYEMIKAYGGVRPFYQDIYISSLFPLAIIRQKKENSWVNANYYDDMELYRMTEDFMIESLQTQIEFGVDTSRIFVLGKKNAQFLDKINKRWNFFDEMVILEHPRYIQQYKQKEKPFYIDKYIRLLTQK